MTEIIGLTGGIASGKSTVAKIFRDQGIAIIDADVLAREAVARGSTGLSEIVEEFGPEILDDSGSLDRKKMGAIIFGDDDKRKKLNHIVHPQVGVLFARAFFELTEQGHAHVVYDVPLLFENNLETMMKATILVAADNATQIKRIRRRDGLNEKDARARIAAQMPLVEKRKRATFVVDNNGTLANLKKRVLATWSEIISETTTSA